MRILHGEVNSRKAAGDNDPKEVDTSSSCSCGAYRVKLDLWTGKASVTTVVAHLLVILWVLLCLQTVGRQFPPPTHPLNRSL